MADNDYSGTLTKEARDLVQLAKDGRLVTVRFRDALADAILEHFERGRSVLLVGPAGVGKTATIAQVAQRMASRGLGSLFEISTTLLLAGTRYIGEWQWKVTAVAKGAIATKAVLYITDAWNLPRVGRTVQSGQNLFDALKPHLESGGLRMVAEATPEVLREMHHTPGFVSLFQTVEVPALEPDHVDRILLETAQERATALDAASRRALVDLTTRFQAARPQPGPALALLEQVIDYKEQEAGVGEDAFIDRGFIERVFTITSGLPAFVVSRDATLREREIRDFFTARIVGQEDAIKAIVETIALFKAGLHDATKPIGTFLFVGPTGVGKTEVARALATFIFGSPQRMLRFDLSEFKDYSSFELLLGNPDRPENPPRLLGPVRAQPFQVVLFDELEKAHPNIWDLLLPLLDEDRLTGPGGDTVDFRNTVLIATSNVGAQDAEAARGLGFGSTGAGPAEKMAKIRRALELGFRPEFLNRFQHVVVFHSLSKEQMRAIARHEMNGVLARDGIASRGLAIEVDDAAIDFVIAKGVDARFGARALKREVQRHIVVPIAMTLMEKPVGPGTVLRIGVKDEHVRVNVIETHTGRQALAWQAEAVRRRETLAELLERMRGLDKRIEEVAGAAVEEDADRKRDILLQERQAPDFWKQPDRVDRVQMELDRLVTSSERMDRLRARAADLRAPLAHRGGPPPQLDRLGGLITDLADAVEDAWNELVAMGWEQHASAIVEVRAMGPLGAPARKLLVETYTAWADFRGMSAQWVREPCEDVEAAVIALKGAWAYGYLRGEAGLHRLRLKAKAEVDDAARVSVASVRVAAWTERREAPFVTAQRALKAVGQHGGKLRSRLECRAAGAGGPLVLQNARTLSENRELAADLVASWGALEIAADDIVRRYDEEPPLLRDVRTGTSTGRPDALAPHRFDALLKRRVHAPPE
jgi:ATP-dependent Clp protease ATP-binding subunit ClpA